MEKRDSKIPSKSHLSQKSQYHNCDIVTIVKDVMVVTKSHICVTVIIARDVIVVTKVTFVSLSQIDLVTKVTFATNIDLVTKVTFVTLVTS